MVLASVSPQDPLPESGKSITLRSEYFVPVAWKPVIATPSTRKLARELNVNLETIRGSGPGGRITDDDVRQYSAGSEVNSSWRRLYRLKGPS